MAQNWTDDTYDPSHEGATDLQNIENNFGCLKSSFSGASAPANAVAGTLWLDTTNQILKIYDGSSWQSIWDYANATLVDNALPNGVTLDQPTITDFTNATHGHSSTTDGGSLGTGITITQPVLDTPTISNFTNAQHNHSGASSGGTLEPTLIADTYYDVSASGGTWTPSAGHYVTLAGVGTSTNFWLQVYVPSLSSWVEINGQTNDAGTYQFWSFTTSGSNIRFLNNSGSTVRVYYKRYR